MTQTVLLKLARGIQTFSRNSSGSFRSWLKTVAHHSWYDLVQSRQYKILKGGTGLRQQLESTEAPDDLAAQLEDEWDQELMKLATDRVKTRVQPKTWEAFEMTAIQGQSTDNVAERLEMSLSAVYKAKSNVVKMLQEESELLEATEFS